MIVMSNVNHPEHYKTGKYECIEVMKEVFGEADVRKFCQMNAFKYLWRADRKNGDEDLKKAKWYLDTLLLSETLNHPEEEHQADPDEDEKVHAESEDFDLGEMFRKAFKQITDIMLEIEDPETETHKRYAVFKKIQGYGCSEELAFWHALNDEVKDEQ